MFGASLAIMTSAVVPFLVTGKSFKRTGNAGYNGRKISLGVVQQKQFNQLARHLHREDWLADPRFASPALRLENSSCRLGAASWQTSRNGKEMSAVGIPCGMVREVGEAAVFPHLADRRLKLPNTMERNSREGTGRNRQCGL
jgi:crotonobetainyl-CoA:carnitine CoA-transferase CaiB-like acyl-CoA transferase